MKHALFLLAATALATTAMPAAAVTVFNTSLSGANEAPMPNTSTATGGGSLVLSDDMNSVDIVLNWAGLIGGPATGAHIHCCSLPGANSAVAIDFGPPSATTGMLTRTYNLTTAGTFTTGFTNANGGTVASARTAFLNGLTSGRTYYNVHNGQFPGGEIRGQLAAVPEPATWGMIIVGFGAIGGTMRRRRGSGTTVAVAA